ncbi:hypothetical protein OG559_20465 [Micromonospora sp. NBC_01405]|uniref:hypothetical protein n=1 Tax=Micromonospora sp. NBC_01405 TaxID=2903589 RepID=UPI0032497491
MSLEMIFEYVPAGRLPGIADDRPGRRSVRVAGSAAPLGAFPTDPVGYRLPPLWTVAGRSTPIHPCRQSVIFHRTCIQ